MSMKGETSEADAPEELGAEEEESPNASSPGGREVEYCGWVYHLGVNSIGHEYCHLRYLFLRGRNVSMFKRDPAEYPAIKPIRKGVISHTFMVEEMGRKKANNGELFVLRFYNRLDETKKGEIACATAGEARKWVEAFDQAKQQILYDLSVGSSLHKLSVETELNLEGHRPRVRRYAHGLRKIVQIGKGPEMLLRQTSTFASNVKTNTYHEGDVGDAKESHDWRCVRTGNGIRIFEDAANPKDGKGTVLKSVSVIDASLDTVFEVVLSLDKKRNEWDMVTGELELLESIDGHYDVVYGTHDDNHLAWGFSKKDFVFSRQWFRGQDGAYMILQFPAIHKNRPPRPGYQRTKINHSIWEIRKINTLSSSTTRCVVTQIVEVHFSGWSSWKRRYCSNFEKTIPYALLCQVAGLKEFFEANPALRLDSPSRTVHLKISNDPGSQTDFEDSDVKDKFYDAIADDESSEDEDSGDDVELPKAAGKVKLRNVSWALAGLALKRSAALTENSEIDSSFPAVTIDLNQFHGSLNRSKSESDTNCWSAPSGESFMIRGKTYLRDSSKVAGGDPLLKLLAVDWLKSKDIIDKIALHPNSLPQTEAGKKLPFILIINLQVPAKPNNSLVLYYATDRPIKKQSLLSKFVDGSDIFRDARFKLIPSVVEGYWMVKRAVGTKACLLAKALTCKYFRQDNFLEIDVDIGSSTVAKSIIGLVLGYVTGLVVDLAILIEATEEKELPEYILGTVRLNRLRPDTAVEA